MSKDAGERDVRLWRDQSRHHARAFATILAIVAAIITVGLSSCGGSGDNSSAATEIDGAASDDPSDSELEALAEQLVDTESVDRRPAVLAELGGPDAFVITVEEIDGTVSRFESWSYFAAGTQVDFVDGELIWDVEVDGIPDGSLLPLAFDPMEITILASRDATFAVLGDVDLTRIESDTELDVDGAEVWAGEQLVLAFVDDQLIYAESFPLMPGALEVEE